MPAPPREMQPASPTRVERFPEVQPGSITVEDSAPASSPADSAPPTVPEEPEQLGDSDRVGPIIQERCTLTGDSRLEDAQGPPGEDSDVQVLSVSGAPAAPASPMSQAILESIAQAEKDGVDPSAVPEYSKTARASTWRCDELHGGGGSAANERSSDRSRSAPRAPRKQQQETCADGASSDDLPLSPQVPRSARTASSAPATASSLTFALQEDGIGSSIELNWMGLMM
eukprot:6627120-Pyramimonas_sp.AAC.1